MAEKLDIQEGAEIPTPDFLWLIDYLPGRYRRAIPQDDAAFVYSEGKVYLRVGKQRNKIAAYLKKVGAFYGGVDYSEAAEGKEAAELFTRAFVEAYKSTDLSSFRLAFYADVEHGYYDTLQSGGPSSCMTHDESDYLCKYNPVRFYNWEIDSRVQLAALYSRKNGDCRARALVDVRDGQVSRVFHINRTDKLIFESLLERAGFELTDGIYGVAFNTKRRKKSGKEWLVVPYLDRGYFHYNPIKGIITIREESHIVDADEYVVESRSAAGMVPRNKQVICNCCDTTVDATELFSNEHLVGGDYENLNICPSCGSRYFSEVDGINYHNDELWYSHRYNRWLLRRDALYSGTLGEYLPESEARAVTLMVNPTGLENDQQIAATGLVTREMATGEDPDGLRAALDNLVRSVSRLRLRMNTSYAQERAAASR